MLTKEQEPTEPWGDLVEGSGLLHGKLSRVLFVLALLFMCFAEALIIHGLWFNQNLSVPFEKRFMLPYYVLLPCLLGYAMRFWIGKKSKIGQISLPAAANLKMSLGVLLMVTYIAIVELAG